MSETFLTHPGFQRQRTELQKIASLLYDVVGLYNDFKLAMSKNFPKTEEVSEVFTKKSTRRLWKTAELIVDFNENLFSEALEARMIHFPLSYFVLSEYVHSQNDSVDSKYIGKLSNSLLDFIEFCWESITDYHEIEAKLNIHYFEFIDGDNNRRSFQQKINKIFDNHNVSFRLNDNGRIEAILPAGLESLINEAQGGVAEEGVDELVTLAVECIRKPKLEDKRIAVEKLWDAFERLKTCVGDYDGRNKLETVDKIIRETAENSAIFTEIMENEMRALTEVGNGKLMIRHCETGKMPISSVKHADYLFYRMLALVTLLRQSISTKA